jgi:NTP pyrophosphatase (non-canonical NTP hydrolase)
MDADHYQQLAARTGWDDPGFVPTKEEIMLLWNACGICGEAGEFMDHIKKGIFHRQGIDKEYCRRELGDILWYIAQTCTKLGFTLSDVMALNDAKLRARYPEGFSPERSKVRDGEAR